MPLSPSATRDILARLGHQPKRFLGQNFLVDGNIVRKSLELAGVSPGDEVVEIGPGLGTLTRALLDAGATVWAVEKDPVLAAHLRDTLDGPAFHLMEGDAVEHPLAGLQPSAAGDFKVVANLPYAISTPWMDAVLSGPLPSRLVLMLQHEAAERYVATPGSKQFGAISIFLQSAYSVERGHRVGAGCFFPRPEVESVLLNLSRRPEPFVFAPGQKSLIRLLFQQRRKQIGSLLRDRLSREAATAWLDVLSAAGLPRTSRAEQVPVTVWQHLSSRGPPGG